MSEVKWVVSKYSPETGEKFEVRDEYNDRYIVSKDGYCYSFLKSEYLPTTPPERWEEVPMGYGTCGSLPDFLMNEGWAKENERFLIQDGKLVLQRKVRG